MITTVPPLVWPSNLLGRGIWVSPHDERVPSAVLDGNGRSITTWTVTATHPALIWRVRQKAPADGSVSLSRETLARRLTDDLRAVTLVSEAGLRASGEHHAAAPALPRQTVLFHVETLRQCHPVTIRQP
ncbi:hypothetical protein ACQVP2_34505 [Methylobacterium aquaticum]|uniref:hypothetical protein n=1 Tax=Methylobacterium aquaticum TaxID=270351 RepID=UPI003D163DBE